VIATIVKLLRIASIGICLIVIVSFGVFAIDQTKSASGRQQEQLAGQASPPQPAGGKKHASGGGSAHKSGLHEALDEASGRLTSPFSGVVSSSSSEWATRGTKLLLALLVYGFGLGFIARTIRVRV